MLNWDELQITIIAPDSFLVTEDEKAYSLDAEQRMIVFTGEPGLDGEDGEDGKSVNPVGDWSVSKDYKFLDLVYRGGNSYIAKKDVPAGVLVTDTEYWMLSATGSDGRTSSILWGEISGSIENQTDLQNALDEVSSTQWGEISGNIENQTDLKNELDGKASAIVAKIPTIQSGTYVVVPIDAEIVGYKATYQVSQEGSGTPSASNIRPFIAAESAVQVNATNYESTPAGASIRTIALPSPIYGGVVDLHNGTVTVTHGHIASYNGESILGEWYSDRDVYAENTTPTLGAEVVYKLKKPIHMYCDPMPTSRYYTHIWVVRNSSNVMSTEYTVEVAYYLQNSSEGVVDTKTYVDQMNAEKANSDDLGLMAYADDAPADNVEYVRKNGDWAVSSGGGGGSGGTPVWGTIIGSLNQQTDLQNALDTKVNAASLGGLASVDDAPSDGSEYVRKNGAWAVSSGGGGGGAGVWGSITGTLSNQTDLQTALDARLRALSIADEFSSTTSYPAGWNYVTYKGVFYRFYGPYRGAFETLTNYEPVYVKTLIDEKANTADLGAMASVADAPSDGKKYGRSDGAWAEISEGGNPAWGNITGTLADQTDLNTALSAKAEASSVYTKTEADALLADKADSADLAGKADASAVYTKTQVDTALSGKADSSAVYSKTDVDTALSTKADSTSVYTKSEVDTALGAKANSADVTASLATKADASSVYTKSEADALLGAKANTADLGDIATKDTVDYLTEIDNIPATFPPESHTHDDRYYTESEVDTLLGGKQNTLTFDTTPTASSTNPVTSGGVKTALDALDDSKVSKSGDTMTGILDTKTMIRIHNDNITFGTAPSSDVWGNSLWFADKDNNYAGVTRVVYRRTGENQFHIGAVQKNGSSSSENFLRLGVDTNGSTSVSVANASAWRNALGASDGIWPTSVGGTGGTDSVWQSYTNSSVFTGTIYYRKVGVFLTITGNIRLANTLSTSSYVTLMNLPSAYRPAKDIIPNAMTHAGSIGIRTFAMRVSSNGDLNLYSHNTDAITTSYTIIFSGFGVLN